MIIKGKPFASASLPSRKYQSVEDFLNDTPDVRALERSRGAGAVR